MGREDVEQPAQDRRRLADQRHLGLCHARGFVRIGVDADDRQIAIDAPLQQRHMQVGADGEHHVRFRPQFVAERQVDGKRIAIVEDAAPAPIGKHRRLQHVRQLRDLG